MDRPDPTGVLLDHAQDKVAVLEEDGTFSYVSGAAKQILGLDPEELIGNNAFEYIHPDDRGNVVRAFERTIRAETFDEVSVEYRHRSANGDWVWLESRMSNLTDSVLGGFVVSSRDISDRMQAERERQATADRLEEIAAASGDVLWMFDADWSEVLFVNPAYEELYGRSVEELRGDPTTFLETIHPEDLPQVKDAMKCLSSGTSVDIEYRVNEAEDYDRWVWVQAEPIVEDGEVRRITGFTRDITDRRRRERQLYVMDNLLRHNLRNDLNVIMGTATVIEDDLPDAADQTAVIRQTGEDLLESAEKGREIIDMVTKRAAPERLDLRDVVEDGLNDIRRRFEVPNLEFVRQESCPVHVRPELRLGVIELVENAIKHAEADSPVVRVSSRCWNDHAEFTVEDEGNPIPRIEADVLEGNHEMSDVYHSSGLGFWLVYWAVELSGGRVTVNSGNSGNRITVRLPLAR
ncbi:MAG: PAS domain S-box protein [Halobellus sp.]|uniref:PAS domain S-box protein n=1 Tax=Halobellus sp. TaxID=1979212 RepID=UPI0035D4B642